ALSVDRDRPCHDALRSRVGLPPFNSVQHPWPRPRPCTMLLDVPFVAGPMQRSRSLLAFAAFVTLAAAPGLRAPRALDPVPTRLLRTPTVSATQIAFAYAQNIWIVDRAGGSARRLTSFAGTTENPKLSPDGRWVAPDT